MFFLERKSECFRLIKKIFLFFFCIIFQNLDCIFGIILKYYYIEILCISNLYLGKMLGWYIMFIFKILKFRVDVFEIQNRFFEISDDFCLIYYFKMDGFFSGYFLYQFLMNIIEFLNNFEKYFGEL